MFTDMPLYPTSSEVYATLPHLVVLIHTHLYMKKPAWRVEVLRD